MKKTTFLGIFRLLAVLLFSAGGFVFAGNISITDNSSTELTVLKSTYTQLELDNVLSDIDFMRVKTKEGYFTMFSVNNYSSTIIEGNPKLPVIKKLIEVPYGATYDVELLYEDFSIINLDDYGITEPVLPVQPSLSKSIDNPEDVEFVYNQDVYQIDDFLGLPKVNVVDLGTMRGVRLARVEIAPVYYNPVKNQIKVYNNLKVNIQFTGGDIATTILKKEEGYSPYFSGMFNQLINYKPAGNGKELIMDEPATYIVVSDPMFEDALQPFIEWKTKKGFQVVEAYTDDPSVGSTTTSIKSYLQDFYNNPPAGYYPQSFVLFVGDINQIPAFSGTSSYHITDLYYNTFDGSGDIYPECFYGRFSAENLGHLQPQIDKTLEYEQYLFPDPSFLDEVVMIAGADASHATTWGNGQINYGTNYYFNAAHGLTSHTYLQPEPGGGNYSQNIHQNVSDGVAYANYTAHCSAIGWADPSFTIADIGPLSNDSKYCLMVGNCCSSVEFQTNCFGEEILRAANKGAVGYIGGSNSTYWDEDFWWGVGMENISANPVYNPNNLGAYDRAFHDNGEDIGDWYITQGQMVQAGNMAVTQAGSSLETYYWEIYHLMGDPSLMIYFSQPPTTTANYQALMPLSVSTFEVNTDPYAYVAISKDGVLHGVGVADASGFAEVTMFDPITVPGDADVVITGQNLQPYIGSVTVASPNGAYVLFDTYEIDDSDGNNNGLVDFDEYIMLDVTLENLGNQTASNLTATISTDDEYVSIDSGSQTWPDITSGNTSMQEEAFSFTVDEMVPDQHMVQFDIEITNGSETWSGQFSVLLNAPVLSAMSYTIDDAAGNNNGRLDPGEMVNVIIPNVNEGNSDALNTMAMMMTSNPMITINNASFDLETIEAGSTKDAVFSISVDAAAPLGEVVTANYNVESSPYAYNTVLSFNIGLMIEDFETGGFDAYAWEFGGNANWTMVETGTYEGNYSAKSGTISHNESSSIMITMDISVDDEISFYQKVSSEDGYDFLRFYIDGVMEGEWDGQGSWSLETFAVTAGVHTFKWAYEKDYSVSSNEDCAWIDYIVFPPFAGSAPLGVFASASPDEICIGESTQLNAFAVGGTGEFTYSWNPVSGLSDPNIANPVATPSVTTTYTVTADDGENTVTDEIEITVNEVPEQPTITQNNNVLVSSASTGNQWYNSEGAIPGAVQQSYMPNATDDYYVMVTNDSGCESEPSEAIHFIYTGVIELNTGQTVNVYPNPFRDQLTVDYSVNGNSAVTISIFNTFGQTIRSMETRQNVAAGTHRVNINTRDLENGIYFIRIETQEYSQLKRIIHSK
ncbi:MAG: T9SS type A sorting domain-containing protein [Bacteroidales bacterium]|nr:T9SS type A sorting domain-containing protein [Bacteroidales bacterium]